MEKEKIDRISELARQSRERELTAEEKAEQAALRLEYIDAMKKSLKTALDHTVVIDAEGKRTRLSDKKPS